MLAFEGTPTGKGVAQEFWVKEGPSRGRPYRKTRFESLPDDVLISIFSVYLDRAQDEEKWSGERTEEWHALVHVCRRWRSVVFASPRHLRLRLICTERRSVKEMDNVWPALPIVIRTSNDTEGWVDERIHNMITALQLNDRVSEISFLEVPDEILESFVAVMEEPFPFLTSLRISSRSTALILPDFFLGGSAPRLQSLHLDFLSFPSLRTLLSSTIGLDKLSLRLALGPGHIPPAAMVSCLSAATRLKSLHLHFRFRFDWPESSREGLAPLTRVVLPDLTHFSWTGTSGYLNGLLAWIDAPQLYTMRMAFDYDRRFISESPQVAQFIGRTERFKEPNRANMTFLTRSAELILPLRTQTVHYPSLELAVNFPRPLWPLSYLVWTCRSSLLPLSTVERLDIDGVRWQPPTENTQWLQLLDLFVAVKDLCVSEKVALHVVQALQAIPVERATEVLPALHNLFIEGLEPSGPVQDAVEQFVATRQLAGHPVAVRPWTSFKGRTENFGRSTVVETSL